MLSGHLRPGVFSSSQKSLLPFCCHFSEILRILANERLNLRIVPIDWHPRYCYAIAGLKVNGKRKRLYFKNARAAKEELERLKIKARRHGQAGLDMPDALRAEAVDCARRLKPYGKTIVDATNFYLHHLAAEESARVSWRSRITCARGSASAFGKPLE